MGIIAPERPSAIQQPPGRPEVDAALPPESPLSMPMQDFRARAARKSRRWPLPLQQRVSRIAVFGGGLALTVFATYQMFLVLDIGTLTTLELVVLVLFAALFIWIALAFTNAIAGFISCALAPLKGTPEEISAPPTTKTALLMPVYNEEPARVIGAIEAIRQSLTAHQVQHHFHIFILSDTTRADIWIAEEKAFLDLRARGDGGAGLFYRRRPRNIDRKSGNIADWVMRFGGAYPQMLVLDADSLMTGKAIIDLARNMERDPEAGLIQSVPLIINAVTVFGRIQQFSGRLYGHLIARGIATWQGGEGNFWGHNAIIRTSAFAQSAGLPHLLGPKPFGGHILSHDFVEAALLRRGGWKVYMVPEIAGSFEEGPSNPIDLAIRDRRWCQGNLQHAALLGMRGAHWLSRFNFASGIASYLAAPVWLIFLAAGMLISLQAKFIQPDYFPTAFSLFPNWPQQDPVRSIAVLIGTSVVLFGPKIMSFLSVILSSGQRRGYGGGMRLITGVIIETILTGLLAPSAMLTQSRCVISVLLGHDGGWQPQQRGDSGYSLMTLMRAYWIHTVLGFMLAAASYAVSPILFLWMSPVIGGLILTVPLVAIVSGSKTGRMFKKLRLLSTPEERQAPEIIYEAAAFRAAIQVDAAAAMQETDPLQQLFADPALLAAHISMLPPDKALASEPIDMPLLIGLAKLESAPTAEQVKRALTAAELTAVLASRRALAMLRTLPQS